MHNTWRWVGFAEFGSDCMFGWLVIRVKRRTIALKFDHQSYVHICVTVCTVLCSRFVMHACISRGSSTEIHVQSMRRRTALMTVLNTSARTVPSCCFVATIFWSHQNYRSCFSSTSAFSVVFRNKLTPKLLLQHDVVTFQCLPAVNPALSHKIKSAFQDPLVLYIATSDIYSHYDC